MSVSAPPHQRPPAHGTRRLLGAAALVLGWAALAAPVALLVFLSSSRSTVIATHEAVIRPTLDGWAVVDLGPFLPSFRYPADGRLGAHVELGRTSATSYDELIQRYAVIAGQPEAQIAKVADAIEQMVVEALAIGGVAGLVVPGTWFLVGPRRRRELAATRRSPALLVVGGTTVLAVVAGAAVRPWTADVDAVTPVTWQPLATALPDVRVPEEAQPLQVDTGLLTRGTQRLVESALQSYRTSSGFYTAAAEDVAALADAVRAAEEGETVAVVVSDRHDNILMDPVAAAIGSLAGATVLLDAGDDTSTGSPWEAFSLESLDDAFADLEHRFHVAGNHDNGDFVTEQADELGFTTLDGEVVDGPDGLRLLGVADPRSSGLGAWRDETGLPGEVLSEGLAEAACAADEDGRRVSTLLVHDADYGTPALERGCVDLVVAGHLHVVVGPDRVRAHDEEKPDGYTFTTGTTGGAAYAIALGTKPRRDATVSLVTYREGRPVGIQWVSLSPLGDFTVSDWTPLDVGDVGDLGEAGDAATAG